MKKGDMVLIPFPCTNLRGIKNRPALVLLATETDITVSFITTQLKWTEYLDILVEPNASNRLKADFNKAEQIGHH